MAVLMEVARDVVARAEAASAEIEEEEKGKSTLEVVLSALWNLSAHCGKNKVRDHSQITSAERGREGGTQILVL